LGERKPLVGMEKRQLGASKAPGKKVRNKEERKSPA